MEKKTPRKRESERERERKKKGRVGRVGTVPVENEKTPAGAEVLADALDHFEERAAIREYDGGQPRSDAERETLMEAARAAGIDVIDLQAARDAKRNKQKATTLDSNTS